MLTAKINIWKIGANDWQCNVVGYTMFLPYAYANGKTTVWSNPMNFVALILRKAEEYNAVVNDAKIEVEFGNFTSEY